VFPGLLETSRSSKRFCSLLGTHNKRYPSIGVGAFFFISFVLYLANPLHRHGTLPFSAHIETHRNSLPPFLAIKYAFTTSIKLSTTRKVQQKLFIQFTSSPQLPPKLLRKLEAYNDKIVSAGYPFLIPEELVNTGMPELEQSSIAKEGIIGGLEQLRQGGGKSAGSLGGIALFASASALFFSLFLSFSLFRVGYTPRLTRFFG
jgi:hypothetical protein